MSEGVEAATPTGPGLARPLPPAPPGYELLERLGAGGMGDVYLARETASERLVAMKFLRFPGDAVLFERFLLELRVLAQLEHPNIVRVLGHDFDRSDPYFTMEYLSGGPLSRLKAEADRRPPAEVLKLFRAVAAAVAAAHAGQVLHRDLKPSNVLLAADGTPKVADFGLAKRLAEFDDLTRTGAELGTPAYMPPEQISRKNGEVGPWSDVYGLGATFYALLTGRAPFTGRSAEEVIPQVLADPPPRPRARCPELSLGLEAVVLKCLEKDPKDRYQTVAELLADLDRYEAGRVPVAPQQTRVRRARRWAVRNRWGFAAAVVVALAVGGVGALVPAKPADHVAGYQRTLKAKKAVALVPATGLPAWYERPIGGVDVATDVVAGGACTVSSVGLGTLVLLPRVEIDRYSVEAEFCELAPLGGLKRIDNHWCALLVGYQTDPLPHGGRMHSFVALKFRDEDVVGKIGNAGYPEYAQCFAAGIIERPGRNPEVALSNPKYYTPYTPSPGYPGKWRKVKFAVAPERLTAFWRDDENQMVPFADWDAALLRERIANAQKTLSLNAPDLGRQLPDWSPRGGIALWCARGAFAVRNVVVTPDP
jgi:serine/threonine-protein kinase